MKGKICCFAGHGENWIHDDGKDQLSKAMKKQLREVILGLIEQEQVRHFICGMERGVDLWAAEIILEFRQCYPITLECAISHEEQAAVWEEGDRNRFFRLIEKADRETMVHTRYREDCVEKRNEYMLNQSDYLISASSGFTLHNHSLRYAQKRKVQVIFLHPESETESKG